MLQRTEPTAWDGPTYYGRPQLKRSPFNEWVVGGYIFAAGLSGGAVLVSTLAEAVRGRDASTTLRNGRYLGMVGPVIGSPLLIWDLHTPQRFYNMLRIAKPTSPMSIGTWILMGFSALNGLGAAGELVSKPLPVIKRTARLFRIPSAVLGSGLGTYTATLLSATSAPFWAASPRLLAARFACSSVAAGSAALSLVEPDTELRGRLGDIATMALAAELAATLASDRILERAGVADSRNGRWGRLEQVGAKGFGVLLPLGLAFAAKLAGPRGRTVLHTAAAGATLAGSLLLRVSTIGIGHDSASRPEISLRFSQPENLPDRAEAGRIRRKLTRLAEIGRRRMGIEPTTRS